MTPAEPLSQIIQSLRTAQQMAHGALAVNEDSDHVGEPRLCKRPLCRRLLADIDALIVYDELVPFGPADFERIRAGLSGRDAPMTDSNDNTETQTETTEVTVEKPAKEVEHTEVTETTERSTDGE